MQARSPAPCPLPPARPNQVANDLYTYAAENQMINNVYTLYVFERKIKTMRRNEENTKSARRAGGGGGRGERSEGSAARAGSEPDASPRARYELHSGEDYAATSFFNMDP